MKIDEVPNDAGVYMIEPIWPGFSPVYLQAQEGQLLKLIVDMFARSFGQSVNPVEALECIRSIKRVVIAKDI